MRDGSPRSETASQRPAGVWLIPANLALAAVVTALGFWADFTITLLWLRVAVATAVLSQALSIGLLARGNRESLLEQVSLIVAVVAAVIWGWSWSAPGDAAMNRLAVLTTAMVIMTALYAAGLARFLPASSLWTIAAKQLLPALLSTTLAALLATLGLEIYQQIELGHVTITPFDTAATGVALVLAFGAAIVVAVVPVGDPPRLSTRGRTACVYAAEIFLAMAFLHVRLTMPWLFGGYFQRFWPLVVIAISFAGIGMGELFRRRDQLVLAGPLQNTGAFLPLLPALAFWVVHSDVNYSTFLLLAGALYSILAILRRSFGFGLLAALAGNGALWHLLDHLQGFGFLVHPQCWLVPFALCFLVATYLNRSHLSAGQMRASHYGCLTLIYLSSTADVFLNGVRQSPQLVYVLGAISIAGVMAGIIFRIRSFLFLGTAFLVLTLITIIWHASVDLHQTWLIWVSGIALGVGIILLFALFEKKRGEVDAVIHGLKEWEG